jgi:hypothetical protein
MNENTHGRLHPLLQPNKNHSATTIASPTTAYQLRPHSTNNNTTTTNVLVPPNQREEKEEEQQQQPPIWVTITDMDEFIGHVRITSDRAALGVYHYIQVPF